MRPMTTPIIARAIIQPSIAFTKPSPPPNTVVITEPAQVTRSAYENPVVATNSAELLAMSAFIDV
jgi:hypothetical protein